MPDEKYTVTALNYVHRRCDKTSEEVGADAFKEETKTRKDVNRITSMFTAQTKQLFNQNNVYSLKLVRSQKHDHSCAILVHGALYSEKDSYGKTSTDGLENIANRAINNYPDTSPQNAELLNVDLFGDTTFSNIIKNGATIRGKVSHEQYAEKIVEHLKHLTDEFEVFQKWEWPALEHDAFEYLSNQLEQQPKARFDSIFFNLKHQMPEDADFPLHLSLYRYRTGLSDATELTQLLDEADLVTGNWIGHFSAHPHYQVLQYKAKWMLLGACKLLLLANKLKHYRQLEEMDIPSLKQKILANLLKIIGGVAAVFGGAAVVATAGLSLAGSAALNAVLSYHSAKLLTNNNQSLRNLLDATPAVFIVLNNYISARFEIDTLFHGDAEGRELHDKAMRLVQAQAVKDRISAGVDAKKLTEKQKLAESLSTLIKDPEKLEIITKAILDSASDAKTVAKLHYDQKKQHLF